MNRSLKAFLLAVIAARLGFGSARADFDIDVHVAVPPPPAIVFPQRSPKWWSCHGRACTTRRKCLEYDMYRYGRYWYVDHGGYWYRARNYAGPFTFVEYSRFPR